jgi:hypothetical protein
MFLAVSPAKAGAQSTRLDPAYAGMTKLCTSSSQHRNQISWIPSTSLEERKADPDQYCQRCAPCLSVVMSFCMNVRSWLSRDYSVVVPRHPFYWLSAESSHIHSDERTCNLDRPPPPSHPASADAPATRRSCLRVAATAIPPTRYRSPFHWYSRQAA